MQQGLLSLTPHCLLGGPSSTAAAPPCSGRCLTLPPDPAASPCRKNNHISVTVRVHSSSVRPLNMYKQFNKTVSVCKESTHFAALIALCPAAAAHRTAPSSTSGSSQACCPSRTTPRSSTRFLQPPRTCSTHVCRNFLFTCPRDAAVVTVTRNTHQHKQTARARLEAAMRLHVSRRDLPQQQCCACAPTLHLRSCHGDMCAMERSHDAQMGNTLRATLM
jgi:hypothetical protein